MMMIIPERLHTVSAIWSLLASCWFICLPHNAELTDDSVVIVVSVVSTSWWQSRTNIVGRAVGINRASGGDHAVGRCGSAV